MVAAVMVAAASDARASVVGVPVDGAGKVVAAWDEVGDQDSAVPVFKDEADGAAKASEVSAVGDRHAVMANGQVAE
jgi:hypothetical protein